MFAPKAPSPPAWLTAPARAEFRRLAAQLAKGRQITELDRDLLAEYCQLGAEIELYRKELDDTVTPVCHADNGATYIHPLAKEIDRKRALRQKMRTELFLTPASRHRQKLQTAPAPAKDTTPDDPLARLLGERPRLAPVVPISPARRRKKISSKSEHKKQ